MAGVNIYDKLRIMEEKLDLILKNQKVLLLDKQKLNKVTSKTMNLNKLGGPK